MSTVVNTMPLFFPLNEKSTAHENTKKAERTLPVLPESEKQLFAGIEQANQNMTKNDIYKMFGIQ